MLGLAEARFQKVEQRARTGGGPVLPGIGTTYPPVPPPLASRVRPFGDGVLGTWPEAPALDDLDGHLAAVAGGADDYVMMGHTGEAFMPGPWLLHFHLVWGPLVVLVQCRYGGQGQQPQGQQPQGQQPGQDGQIGLDAERVEGQLGEVSALVSACGFARIADFLPSPGRLVVVNDDVGGSWWGWGPLDASGRPIDARVGGSGSDALSQARAWAESLEEPAPL